MFTEYKTVRNDLSTKKAIAHFFCFSLVILLMLSPEFETLDLQVISDFTYGSIYINE